jgi:hypothetical protein
MRSAVSLQTEDIMAPIVPPQFDPFGRDTHGTKRDLINVAAIRVAGVGGVGLAAVALGVALDVPRIGQTLALSAVLGMLFATILILRRRRTGPMRSSGQELGANTTLAIDKPGR